MIGFDWFLVPRFAHRRACRRRHGRVGVVVGEPRSSSRGFVDWRGRSKLLAGGTVGDWRSPEDGRWSSSPIGGETLVTDGRVDDQLVWWSGCSKLSAWSPVRVSQVVISGLRWSGRTVTESVQSETIWPDEISGQPCWMEMSPMVGWPGLAVGSWVENDGIYTTSLTCTNTPHSRGARKQAHLHRGEGSVMDSLLISGRLHCQPSRQRECSTIEGQPHTRPHNRPDPPLLAGEHSPRMVAPAEEIRGHRRHGERSAPSREVAFSHKSPCPSTQRGRPTPELDARANHLASPARADVQRQ